MDAFGSADITANAAKQLLTEGVHWAVKTSFKLVSAMETSLARFLM